MGEQKKTQSRVSRRDLIRGGSEVIGAAAAISGGALFAQQATGPGSQRTASPNLAGRMIKAFVRRPQGASVQQVKLWALRDDMVAVRTEASQCCYTIVNQALGSGDVGAGGAGGAAAARTLGHGGVGIVEATGSAVERIRPGDRVR